MSSSASTQEPRKAPPKRTPTLDNLYCINADGSRNTIHTADVKGRFQRRKKLIWAVLITFYLALPWVQINGNPAVLVDIARRNFYLFGATFNVQDFYLFYFVLTGIGFTLFVVSSLFGRVWCGYSCPHTVFLEGVYRRIERWLEGNAAQRKKLAEMPWNKTKILRRGGKWVVFAVLSTFLSHTLLSYFLGVDGVYEAVTSPPSEHSVAFSFVVAFSIIIYGNFAWFREQLCIVICPYGRLQGVLYDGDTINVTYDHVRGEPRGRYTTEERGDCIDCHRCVAVCPTGIDIRNGTQLECVGCANCIDACDEVMEKVGQPKGLIRYDSQNGVETGQRRIIRPRLFLYAALLVMGVVVFSVAIANRRPFEAQVVRQQTAPYTILAESNELKNDYFLHLVNKRDQDHVFLIEPVELAGVRFLVPQTRTALGGMKDQRVPFFVFVSRDIWQVGMQVQLRVHSEDGTMEEVVSAPVLGPR